MREFLYNQSGGNNDDTLFFKQLNPSRVKNLYFGVIIVAFDWFYINEKIR